MNLLTTEQLTQKTQISSRTMFRLRYKGDWERGIHYFKISPRKILYNLDLIQDWIANQHQPELHENAIKAFLASLPSSDRPVRIRTNTKKAGQAPAQGDKNA